MFNFFKKKPKEKLDCLGYYDIKPYHYFESNMVYAKDILVLKDNFGKVYTRLFKGTIFIFTFVDNENGFIKQNYNYEALKDKIDAVILEGHNSVVNLIIFKNDTPETIRIAKEVVVNTKKEFNQTFVYDADNVRLKFYRPVPSFYSLYNHYIEAMVFDLGAIDLEKR
ncbi:MAG: hypothetical protein NC087_02570 [Anaeroplasma bactoclasticum]|nr:hypothetical protein [Anaeroplasma bactoclasticum]MCM1556400.1 hypothetical protein [Anaeroplasma bactoclasticum]